MTFFVPVTDDVFVQPSASMDHLKRSFGFTICKSFSTFMTLSRDELARVCALANFTPSELAIAQIQVTEILKEERDRAKREYEASRAEEAAS